MKIDLTKYLSSNLIDSTSPTQVAAFEDQAGNLHRTAAEATRANLLAQEKQLRDKIAERLRDMGSEDLFRELNDGDTLVQIREWIMFRMVIDNLGRDEEAEWLAALARGVQETISGLHKAGVPTTHIINDRIVVIHPDGRHEDQGPAAS
jgi:hypothetical protein